MFESIKIFHHWHHNDEYLFWKDFFNLVGLYVSDFSSEFDNLSSDYSAILVLKNDISDEKINVFKRRYSNAIILDNYSDFKNLNTYFKKGLKSIKENCYELSDNDYEVLQQIGDIYIKYKISYHTNACKSVLKTNKEAIYKLAENDYVDALIEVNKLPKINNFYFLYTFSNLRYLVNYSHYNSLGPYGQYFPLVDPTENIALLKELINLFPNFGKSYLLLVKEYRLFDIKKERKKSLIYTQMLLETMYQKPYDSAFYDVAKIYFHYLKKQDDMRKMYFKANVNNNSIPKYHYYNGLILKKEDVNAAQAKFEKVYSLLYNKYLNHYLLPEEEIYFMLTIVELRNIYGDYLWDIKNFKKYCALIDEFIESLDKKENSVAAQEIFGDKAHVLQRNLRDDFIVKKNK